ncbi:helix-turn-helix domain-containing protein [Legionella erythra]|uniref:DNA-binding transcriptional regulator n=1 Tax=Legionella erythra TaxID=448 RepID=A0A0W0TU73_LEGER|nr:XRE family transcriptional regulator [Legionella erythra]KTC98984.1 DNA-binding transcriptional regulator [Legionella erythra]
MRYNAQIEHSTVRYNAQALGGKILDIFAQHIANHLKSLRQQRGWSLDKAAQETGVSKAMLGQIERLESSPTVATLWKIASGFHVSFSSFLEDSPDNAAETLYRPKPQQALQHADEHLIITSLFPFDPELRFECFLIELLPHSEQFSSPHEPGVIEHIIVVDGDVEILVHQDWHKLHAGDGLRFDASKPHGYRNTRDKSAFFHDIIHYPRQLTPE